MKLEEILGVSEKEMKELVKKLPNSKTKKIIEYRYGLNDGVYKTLADTSKDLNITMEEVRQIEARGLRQMKNNLPKKSFIAKIISIFK